MAVIGCSENAHDFLRASITVRTADLLFDWFGFSSFSYIEINKRFNCMVIFKTLKQEVSRT